MSNITRLKHAPTDWDSCPTHKPDKPHVVKEIVFAEIGCDNTIECKCGWNYRGPSPEHVEDAWLQHRRDMGLVASRLTIGMFPPKKSLTTAERIG